MEDFMSSDAVTIPGRAGTSSATQSPITAVDIVLEPDATMIQNAKAANARLLKNFPKGYSLDEEHAPHISVIGGYFYTANLDEVLAGASKVLASEKVMSWKLKAFKYYYIPLKEIGLGGILVEPTADLIRLQNELFQTIGKFIASPSSGTAAAFSVTPANPEINQATIDAVAYYFSEHRGEHYRPHVTIGVGTVDYLNALLAAPFPTFTFSAAGASAYQFGNFGTAAKRLHSFTLTH
jgi:hypothetical protein